MSHVFISYNRQDRAYVEQLATFLQEQLFNVWFDARIAPSDEWWDRIEDAIEQCGAFIIIMTPAAHKSKWVKREMLLADKLGKPVFPLLLDGEEWNFYVHVQYEDVREGQNPSFDFVGRLMEFAAVDVPSTYNVTDFSPSEELQMAGGRRKRRTASANGLDQDTTTSSAVREATDQKYVPTWPLVVGGLVAVPALVMFGLMIIMDYIGLAYGGWIPALGWPLLAATAVILLYVREVAITSIRNKYMDQLFVGILWGAFALVGALGFVVLMIAAAIFGAQTFDRTVTTLLLGLMIVGAGLTVWRSR